MSNLSVTAANVAAAVGAGNITEVGTFGGTITAGMLVYKDPADLKYKAADSGHAAPVCKLYGMALNGGSAGQPGLVLRAGNVNPGATMTVGQIYILSSTSGGGNIAPVSDLTTGWRTAVLGIATTASNLLLCISAGNVAKA